MFPLIRYYATEAEFQTFHERLKQVRCPHCGRVGTLNLHDRLYGHPERPGGRVLRGRRVFCNSRLRRRPGCGRTVAIRRLAYLRGFIITAASLWRFFAGVSAGVSKRAAFRALGTGLHESGGWRLYRRAAQGLSRLRSFLIRHCSVPEPPPTRDPVLATLLLVRDSFPDTSCPIRAFHRHFQASFL